MIATLHSRLTLNSPLSSALANMFPGGLKMVPKDAESAFDPAGEVLLVGILVQCRGLKVAPNHIAHLRYSDAIGGGADMANAWQSGVADPFRPSRG